MRLASRQRRFAFAQARIQARYGELPAAADWRRLSGTRGFGAWLEEARSGPLRDWIKGLSAASRAQEIEAVLRNRLLAQIDAVAGFVPNPWSGAVRWTRWLPLLGLLEHLRIGHPAPAWALTLAPMQSLLDDAGKLLPERVRASELGPVLEADAGVPLDQHWMAAWRQRWPATTAAVRADLAVLEQVLQGHLDRFRRGTTEGAWDERQRLRVRLQRDFHGLVLSPVAPFGYLVLLALDLERVRAALLDRALFVEPSSAPAAPAAPEQEAA